MGNESNGTEPKRRCRMGAGGHGNLGKVVWKKGEKSAQSGRIKRIGHFLVHSSRSYDNKLSLICFIKVSPLHKLFT